MSTPRIHVIHHLQQRFLGHAAATLGDVGESGATLAGAIFGVFARVVGSRAGA